MQMFVFAGVFYYLQTSFQVPFHSQKHPAYWYCKDTGPDIDKMLLPFTQELNELAKV